ncbi:unnamed protein product [Phytophthora fragariaefolia]|uniref:Unnamed protein product n=1 Tax=Phytophthora fragariaefolia TaxID=1490495 RepID=A0A9W7D2X1_9STRA|nr:unnamed protein product [Phytophthora fragariaefolia]
MSSKRPTESPLNLQSPKQKSKKTRHPYNPNNNALRIRANFVTSVKCRFCDVFKREERKPTSDIAKPRKKTTNLKYFKTFRPSCYKQHLETEHPAKWTETRRFISNGATLAHFVRDETGLSVYTGSTNTLVSNSARVLCAAALQYLRTAIDLDTGFSIALDTSTLHGKSYLDVRARFSLKGALYNFHLMAIPLYEEHTGEIVFATLSSFLDTLVPEWRHLLVGVSTDGDSSTTGRIRGVAARLEASVPTKKLVRVWCALHLLDLVVQRVHKSSLDEEFLSAVTSMTGHLRWQPTLIMTMGSTCPLLKRSQRDRQARSEVCGAYALSHACAPKFMFEIDPWVKDIPECATEEDEAQFLYAAVGKMFVQAVDGISSIVAERTSDNTSSNYVPPVLPHRLMPIDVSLFNQLMHEHHQRLLVRLSDVEVHRIAQQFLRTPDNILRLALDTIDEETTTFGEGWGTVGEGYDLLKQFCGELASTFPNNATVESDFSDLGWETDEYRRSITDFFTGGCDAFQALQSFERACRELDSLI